MPKSKSKKSKKSISSGSIRFFTKKLIFGDKKNKYKKKKKDNTDALPKDCSELYEGDNTFLRSSGQNISDPLLLNKSSTSSYDEFFKVKDSDDLSSDDDGSLNKCTPYKLTTVKDSGVFLFDGEEGVLTESNPSLETYFYNINISPIKEIEENVNYQYVNFEDSTTVLEKTSINKKRSSMDNFLNCFIQFLHNLNCTRNKKN